MKKINYLSILFIFSFFALSMNSFALDLSFERVDANLTDWTGNYIIVYEAQAAMSSGGNTYQGKTVLVFNPGSEVPNDAGGNVIVLSPTTPGAPEDLATITGGVVTRTETEVTVTGGSVKWDDKLIPTIISIDAVDGGWSLKTVGGYYLGNGGNTAGSLGVASTEFDNTRHIHAISIGNADSNVAGNSGVTFHGCAIIQNNVTGVNNTVRINGGTGRFGYWGIVSPANLYGQHPVALYKLNGLLSSVKDIKAQIELKINIAGKKANINADTAIFSLSVLDVAGKVISREQFSNKSETSRQISIQDLPNGVYIINVETSKGTKAEKVIINEKR